MSVTVLVGDCREQLRTLPDASVHTCVTSPPYFGLRDYGVAGQMGLEITPDEFIAGMVEVFREVRRVLRDDGTLWLNIGDSYANDGKWGGHTGGKHAAALHCSPIGRNKRYTGLKPKDLIGIPWMLAFALRADGWHLRQDIIWSKPNPMPESVRDRCTKAHEYLFMLSKGPRYHYDADAVAEAAVRIDQGAWTDNPANDKQRGHGRRPEGFNGRYAERIREEGAPTTRNKRSVWEIATRPFKEAHFATYPPALVEPCVLAGTAERCCDTCAAPWRRVSERRLMPTAKAAKTFVIDQRDLAADPGDQGANRQKDGHKPGYAYVVTTKGMAPTCRCYDHLYETCPKPRSPRKREQRDAWPDRARRLRRRPAPDHWPSAPAVVLDPFFGAGTTGLVADRLQRDCIGIELNPKYAEIARRRLLSEAGMFAEIAA